MGIKNIIKKQEKGITLVALVVTIIVLLILAFIGISILMGKDGVVEKAKESKEETIKAQEREYIKLAYQKLELELNTNGSSITADRLENELKNYDNNIIVNTIQETEIGDREVVVDREGGPEYAEITYEETEHEYVVPLVIDPSKTRYVITFDANGGQGGPTKQTKIEGTDLAITTEIPYRNESTFIGWSENKSSTTAEYLPGGIYTKDNNTTLYAVWKDIMYNITYNLDGGTVEGNPTSYSINSAQIRIKNPYKKGYLFDGWTGTDINGKSKEVIIPTGSKGNRIYTATWIEAGFVDNTAPTAGTLIAKEENSTGNNYIYDTWTEKNVYVEKIDGTDTESVAITTYTVEKNGEVIFDSIAEPTTLTETGTYSIIVTTTDAQGNSTTSGPYIIKIDKTVPEFTLKHTTPNGTNYELGTWTKDDLYGKININTSLNGKTVEKYQYSYDENEWYDISETPYSDSLNYTTKFPMSDEKPEWITGPIAGYPGENSEYFFEIDEDGKLVPNNMGIKDTIAESIFEINLEEHPDKKIELILNATIDCNENSSMAGAAIIDENYDNPNIFIYDSGYLGTSDYSVTITGGQKYYLDIAFMNNTSEEVSNQDIFSINSITLKSDDFSTVTGITFNDYSKNGNKVEFNLKNTLDKQIYIRAVYNSSENDYSLDTSSNSIKIDKSLPAVGKIIMKREDNNGSELKNNSSTASNVYIEKVDGVDNESGHKKTCYTIKKDDTLLFENIEEPKTLTEEGTYIINITTEDNAGNISQGEQYIITIDRVQPSLILKYNDANGANYEQGTWTNDNIYAEIDIGNADRNVEKYQYSMNETNWYDITSESTGLDYTTTFPMSDKPEWINGPISDGEYYFEVQEDGTLKPNNRGIHDTSAISYFEIDLTEYPNSSLELTINATISCEINYYDYGIAAIVGNNFEEEFINVCGETNTDDYAVTIPGGEKYYLYIGYFKDELDEEAFDDTFTINSITLKSQTIGGILSFNNYNKQNNKVSFILNKDISKDIYIRPVYKDGNFGSSTDNISIRIDKTAPVLENSKILMISETKAKANVVTRDSGSGTKEYYISIEETVPTSSSAWNQVDSNEFTIEGLNTKTTYYLWLKDNVGNISESYEIVVESPNYSIDNNLAAETLQEAIELSTDGSTIKLLNDYIDESYVEFNKNITFDIQNYTLTRNSTITIYDEKIVEITGTGKITSGTSSVNTITNYGRLTISNSVVIENNRNSTTYAPIRNYSDSAVININDNVQIIGYYRGIYNDSGTININGGKIEATYSSSSAYGIYNYSNSSKTYITNGEIKGYYGIRNNNSSSIVEMTGGKVIGTGAEGIYASGTTNIYGGRIEGKTYGICSYATDKVTIGREEDELSTTVPAIYGASYGIYMDEEIYGFNFYNGVIKSNMEKTTYRGEINPRTGHMPYTYFDEEDNKYHTILIKTEEKITMEATPIEYTNGEVTVRIAYPYQDVIRQYSEDGIIWKETEEYIQEVIVAENKIIYARIIEESGIITDENQIEITNIDKEKPTVTITPSQTVYKVTETNGTVDLNITLTAQDTGVSGLDKMQYAWVEEGEEIVYTDFINTVTISKSKLGIGQYNLYINVTDKAGNKADLVQKRYTVKYEEPVCQIGTTKYITIQSAVEACNKDAIRTEYSYLSYETSFPMSGNRPKWISEPVSNGTYYFEVQEDGTLKPNNNGIDSVTANSYFEIDLTEYPDAELEITLNTTISSETNYDFGYATITTSTRAPEYNFTDGQFINVSGSTTTANYTTKLTGGQKFYLHIGYRKDGAEYSYNDTFIINSIKLEATFPEKIAEAPTIIEMLKSTDEEFETYEGQNIILDLKGHTVGSSSIETPLCINNETLQLVDTSTNKTGKLESLNGTAILNNGTLIIGDNTTEIEYEVPTIYGYKIGVENNNIFNFYDGKIQGITPIKGNTTDTPEEYGPVSTGYENGITTIQLGIVTGYEARIEWVYYTTVQEAVNATKIYSNDYRDKVTIIKDIQLTNILEINPIKDIILDLYGYTLTISSEKNTVINNYGNLEITDSSIEQTGEIAINSSKNGTSSSNEISTMAISNNNSGQLIISGGKINSITTGKYNYCSGIYNSSTGNITITSGTISSSNSNNFSYGIYNYGNGIVTVTGGTVSSSSDSRYSNYGIYNASSGTIEVTGGTVSSNNSSSSYGIYNYKGTVKVTGGTVSSSSSDSDSYGIYNSSSESIEVTGGTVSSSCSSDGDSYGIYNSSSGSIEITGGTVSSSCSSYDYSYGIYNYKGTVKVTGGTVSSSSSYSYSYSYGIYNSSSGSIEITGGTVSGSKYGIYNNGSIEVTGGTVSSSSSYNDSYGIYNASSGRIIIGIKEDKLTQKEKPTIIGDYLGTSTEYESYGIYNNINGELELYNGIIQGNIALSGTVTKIREGYKIEKTIIDELEAIYLVEKVSTEYVVQIGETKYYSLKEAIESIGEEEKTIEVLRDFELEEIVEFNKNIILDLNGYTITNNYYGISNKGNLIITDTTEKKLGKIECFETIISIKNKDNSNLSITGGTVSGSSNYGIYNEGSGSIEIIEGTVSGSKYGIYNWSIGNVTITGGIVKGIYNSNSGSIEITGGTVSGIYNNGSGSIEVTGGTVNGIYNNGSGSIEVIGGTVSSNDYGIYNWSTGNVTITGGTVSGSSKYGIYNNRSGSIEVTGGTVSGHWYGIYNKGSGSIEVTGGTVNSSSISYNSYGIYNYSTGTIIIGIGDGIVSQEEPYIKGEYKGTSSSYVGYGIYNTKGKLYFYDGKLEGTTKAFYDILTEYEENAELNYNEDETILTLSTTLTPVAEIGSITYNTLEEAINAAGSTQTTIKILRNVAYTKNDNVITIPNTKNIILDLNGYKISSAIPGKVIENNGILEIIDTSTNQTGIITTSEETTISNISGAKLVISGVIIENRVKYVIYNTGDVNIKSGEISGENYGIYNASTGSVELSGGTITTNFESDSISYGIYNASSGTVKVTGGAISISRENSSYGIYNYKGTVKVTGGTISISSYYSSNGIYNANSGSIEVTGGTVSSSSSNSSSYGIYNKGSGSIEVTGGIVSSISSSSNLYSNSCGIYNDSTGTITIGEKNNGTISTTEPEIIGCNEINDKGYGIYNPNGVLKYYEGTIKGQTKSIYGNISEIEDYTELDISSETIDSIVYEVLTLQQTTTNVARVNGTEYDSIEKAIKACGIAESTIEILRNSDLGATIIIEANQNITIDLKGYTINNYTELQNKGTLKIKDSSTGQAGKIVGLSGILVSNTGTMELQSGSIADSGYGIKNTGTLTVNGGTISNNTYGIYNDSNGIINVNSGNITSNTYGIYNYSGSSTINVNEGEISSNEYGIYNYSGTTNITGTAITGNDYGIYNAGGTTNIKEGAEIQSDIGIYVAGGRVNIGETGTMNSSSPIVTGETYGLSVSPAGLVYMYDGQIKGKSGATQGFITYTETGYAVVNKVEGEYFVDYLALAGTIDAVAEVNEVKYSNLQSAINSVIGEETQTIKLLNGIISDITFNISEGQNIILDMNEKTISSNLDVTINNAGNLTIIDSTSSGVGKITSTVGTAIVNSGTLTLGQDDGTVSQDLITIEGNTYGIENTGELNFYDGTINGASAVNGTIANRATGYVIRITTVNGKERYYLSI